MTASTALCINIQAGVATKQGRNNDFGLDIDAVLRRLREGKIEISCANGADLRDNDFNIGGLAFWDGIGQMHMVPVEWDDILWKRLNRLLMINTVINKQVKLYF
jgi:hypothetical protein